MVYQKNIESKEIEVLKNNVIFVKNIKELIFAIDKEQNSIKKYLSTQKETLDLQKDYKSTDDAYDNLMNSVKILNLQLKVENLNYYIDEIENLRLSVQNKTDNLLDINETYRSTKKDILSSLFFAKQFKYINNSNFDAGKIVEFLTEDENTKYLKEFLSSLLESLEKESYSFSNQVLDDRKLALIFSIIVF